MDEDSLPAGYDNLVTGTQRVKVGASSPGQATYRTGISQGFRLPSQMPRVETIGLSAPVLAFALGLSVLVVLLAGMLPARLAVRVRLAATLQQDSRTVAGAAVALRDFDVRATSNVAALYARD